MDDQKRALRILALNSAITYLLAFFIVYIPTQLGTFLAAYSFNIPTGFTFFKIDFQIADYSSLWTQQSIVGTYIATPAVCLLIAIFGIRFIKLYSYFKGPSANLLVTWIYAHSVNILLGGILVGIPLVKGTGFVFSWLFFPAFISWLMVALACIMLFLNGLILRAAFISLVPDIQYLRNPYLSLIYKIPVVFLPSFVINILFFFIDFPDNSLYEKLLLITMFVQLFMVIPFSYNYFEVREDYTKISYSKKSIFLLILSFLALILWKYFHNKAVGL